MILGSQGLKYAWTYTSYIIGREVNWASDTPKPCSPGLYLVSVRNKPLILHVARFTEDEMIAALMEMRELRTYYRENP